MRIVGISSFQRIDHPLDVDVEMLLQLTAVGRQVLGIAVTIDGVEPSQFNQVGCDVSFGEAIFPDLCGFYDTHNSVVKAIDLPYSA